MKFDPQLQREVEEGKHVRLTLKDMTLLFGGERFAAGGYTIRDIDLRTDSTPISWNRGPVYYRIPADGNEWWRADYAKTLFTHPIGPWLA